ncbi:glutamate 5-kinase [Maricaulis sp.]|uniref:glutamate 5-kinase n=1 Tax=Maricaulis sp. TaxID=1486257 RepID=UPI0026200DEC|nr:glutamate 5-kinase [Maricaulis sp.]
MSRPDLQTAGRIVVKIGSTLLQAGAPIINAIARDVATLCETGSQCVIVSSGAVALGRPRLGLASQTLSLEQKQAAAAAGQPVLVNTWEQAFAAHGRSTAQALLTLDVTDNRRRWLNARATLDTLLELGAIPIVNENDTVATDEIRYGDNDRLAARVAQLIGAECLVLLSDIDGLYNADPRTHPDAERIAEITRIDDTVRAMAGGANTAAGAGTGGMRSKIMAAEIATASGCSVIIGDGRKTSPVARLAGSECGSLFSPAVSAASARERWISGAASPHGEIMIDAGALQALRAGKSLLAVGVVAIKGQFMRGDTVRITDADGHTLARGVSAYDAADATRIAGRRTEEIEAILGYRRTAALVHADDLVLEQQFAKASST